MWQLFLERFIPVMEDDTSVLDVRDGVGPALGSWVTGADTLGAALGDTSALTA